jgi:phosphoadenosine phosphosulfate reductase
MGKRRLTPKEAAGALRKLQNQPLAAKVKRAGQIIRAAIGTGRAVLAFSGGRDSVALAILARQVDPSIPLVYVDTGLADPRLTRIVRRIGGRHLTYLGNPVDPETTWQTEAIPIGAKVSSSAYRRDCPELRINPSRCCALHKAAPVEAWLDKAEMTALISGARGDDSTRHRFKLQSGEIFRDRRRGHFLAYPLLTWLQADTLAFLETEAPDYPLRYARNEELGCRACAINLARWPNQMGKLRQCDPDYHRHLITACGYGLEILQIKYKLTRDSAAELADRDGWPKLIESGALDRIPYPRTAWR